MSVAVAVLRAQEDPIGGFENVIGYVIAAVVKQSDGGISLEREIAVHADNAEDNELAESVVKTIERKLNEAFPDPNQRVPEAKLWVPE
jgi:hypothetical protein